MLNILRSSYLYRKSVRKRASIYIINSCILVYCTHIQYRPFQGSYRHIAGGAKTLGRARGHQWRP